MKVILKGNVGAQTLDVVPPNAGDDVPHHPGSGTYCAAFGGAAGGTEVKDTAALEGHERDGTGMPVNAVAR